MQDQHQLALRGGAQDGIMQQQGTLRYLPHGEGGFAVAPLLRVAVLLVLAVPSTGTQLKRRQVPFGTPPAWSLAVAPASAYAPSPAGPGVVQGSWPPSNRYPTYPANQLYRYPAYPAFPPATAYYPVAYNPAAAPSPAAAQVPAPAPGPGFQLPKITLQTCAALVGQVGAELCQIYNWGDELGSGCACFVSGRRCLEAPNAEAQGFIGGVVATDPLTVPNTDGPRTTCFYRQWQWDPGLVGPLREMQERQSKDRTLHYIGEAYERARANAEVAANPMKQLSKPFFPLPLRMPKMPPMMAPEPAPAPSAAAAPGTMSVPASAQAAASATPQFGPAGSTSPLQQQAYGVQPTALQPPGPVAAARPLQQATAVTPLQKAQPQPPPGLAMPAAPLQQTQQAAWPLPNAQLPAASHYAQPPMGQLPPLQQMQPILGWPPPPGVYPR